MVLIRSTSFFYQGLKIMQSRKLQALLPKKIAWRIAAVLGLFFGLLAIAVLLAVIFIDVEALRKPLAVKISAATGYRVEMQTLDLSIYPVLGLKAGGLQVRSESRDLFAAESLFIEADLPSLLRRQVKIKKVILLKPVVALHLEGPEKKSAAAAKPAKSEPGAARGKPRPQKLAAPPMDGFREFLARRDISLNDLEVRRGRIDIFPAGGAPPFSLTVSSSLQVRRKGERQVDVVLGPARVNPGNLTLSVQVRDALAANASARVSIISNGFSLADLKFMRRFLPGSFEDWLNRAHASATVEKISLNADAPLNRLLNLDWFQNDIDAAVGLQIRDTSLNVEGYQLVVPGIDVAGTLKEGKFSQTIRGRFLDGDFLLDLAVQPGKNPSDFRSFSLDSHMRFNGMNPARLERFAAAGAVFPDGGVSGALQIAGRSLKPQDIHVSGTLKGENLASADRRYAARRAVIDLQSLRRNRGTVKFTLQGAKIDATDLRKITGNLLLSRKKIHLARGRILPAHGEIRVTGDYAMARQSYDSQFSASGLRAEEFLKDKLTGQLQFAGRLRGRLNEADATRGLSGKVNVKLADGNILTADFIGALLQLLNLHTILEDGRPGLSYKYLGGDFHLAGGVLSTDNLRLDGSQLKLLAKGRVDLPTGRLNGEIRAMPLQLVDEVARTIPLLGSLLTAQGKGGVIETYFNVAGTLDNPDITFDPAKSVLSAPEKILKGIFNLPDALLKGGK